MFAGPSLRLAVASWFFVAMAAAPRQSPVSPLVLVDVAVESADGQAVAGLTKEDFAISSGGATPPIEFFAASAGQPLSLVLLFDTSASVNDVISRSVRAGERREMVPASAGAGRSRPRRIVRPPDRDRALPRRQSRKSCSRPSARRSTHAKPIPSARRRSGMRLPPQSRHCRQDRRPARSAAPHRRASHR